MNLLFSLLAGDIANGTTPPPGLGEENGCEKLATVFLVFGILFLIVLFFLLAKSAKKGGNRKHTQTGESKNPTETKTNEQSQATTFENQPLTPDEQELLANYRKSKEQNSDRRTK